ncbi:STAS-like domain-containing protein [Shigella flexneri]
MKEIMVKDLINAKYAVSYESASKVYSLIKEAIIDDKVTLNFSGISVLSSPFLSGTIGLLLQDYSVSELKEKVSLTNLPAGSSNTVDVVIKNCESFYGKK